MMASWLHEAGVGVELGADAQGDELPAVLVVDEQHPIADGIGAAHAALTDSLAGSLADSVERVGPSVTGTAAPPGSSGSSRSGGAPRPARRGDRRRTPRPWSERRTRARVQLDLLGLGLGRGSAADALARKPK